MGIRDRPISPGSPWQNGIAERVIGTLRRECLDRMLNFGEPHLRRVLASYAAYYNQTRTHLALQKDAPLHRAANGLVSLSPFRSWPDCIISTSGYDFRKAQVNVRIWVIADIKIAATTSATDVMIAALRRKRLRLEKNLEDTERKAIVAIENESDFDR